MIAAIEAVLQALPSLATHSGCLPRYWAEWEQTQRAREIARNHPSLEAIAGDHLQALVDTSGEIVRMAMEHQVTQAVLVEALLKLQDKKKAAEGWEPPAADGKLDLSDLDGQDAAE